MAIKAQPALESVRQYSKKHTSANQYSPNGVCLCVCVLFVCLVCLFDLFRHLETGALAAVISWRPPRRKKQCTLIREGLLFGGIITSTQGLLENGSILWSELLG